MAFVEEGIVQGRRQDLTGGGLLRSAGGWEGVKALREEADCRGPESIVLLGSEGTGGTHVFSGAQTGEIDSVCQ